MLTLVGMVLLLLVGTLFGQSIAAWVRSRSSLMILVPLANLAVAALVAPTFVRSVDRDTTAFRYP